MRHFLTLLLFSLFVTTAAAQNTDAFLKEIQSPRWLLFQEAQERPLYRALWNGQGAFTGAIIFFRAGAESELGLTEEQANRLAFLRKDNELGKDLMRRKFQEKDPELMAAHEASEAAIPKDDPYMERATEEQKKAFVAANEAFFKLPVEYMDREVAETLTPEQMEKVQALKLQLQPEMGLPSASMLEPLGLTDEQKEQMAAVKKEMEPEFEKLLDEMMELRKEELKLMVETMTADIQESKPESVEEIMKAMRTASQKSSNNESLRKKYRENKERGSKFAARLKAKLMNVLTDEQLDKMQKMLDDTPDFAKKMLAGMRKSREALEKSDKWQPGPDSWRPGDGTPEEFKLERKKGAFPKSS